MGSNLYYPITITVSTEYVIINGVKRTYKLYAAISDYLSIELDFSSGFRRTKTARSSKDNR
eukprot:9489368-Pyramimonas_sp.AAC.2